MLFGTAEHPDWFEEEELEESFPTDWRGTFGTSYFLGFFFFTTIVMLNLLIAIMSNSYEKVAQKAEVELTRARAQELVDLELIFVRKGKMKNRFHRMLQKCVKRLFCCFTARTPVLQGDEVEAGDKDMYEEAFPNVLHVLYKLDDYNTEVVDQLAKMEDEDALHVLQDKIANMHQNLLEAIASNQKNTNEVLSRLQSRIDKVVKMEKENKRMLAKDQHIMQKNSLYFQKDSKKPINKSKRRN